MNKAVRMDLVEKYIKLVESVEQEQSVVNDAWDALSVDEKAQVRQLRNVK